MNITERKLRTVNVALGVGLTLIVAMLDHSGGLVALERWFYDRRALWCQHFRPAHSDKIVHVDIDDSAINTIGRWPWPRAVQAQLLREIDAAGPRVIAMDITLPDPQQVEKRTAADGTVHEIDHDALLARAIQDSGRVLIAVSLGFEDQRSIAASAPAMEEILRADLELTPEQVEGRLAAAGQSYPASREVLRSQFVAARRAAMYDRITAELAQSNLSPEVLRARLLPHTDALVTHSPLLRLLDEQCHNAQKVAPLRRFTRPIDGNTPALLASGQEVFPMPAFSQAASGAAFVDYIMQEGGKVRTMPLWARHGDRAFPQMGLSVACALLGVDPREIRIESERLVIPRRDAPDIIIPVRMHRQPGSGREVNAVIDISYFGGADWRTMYFASKLDSARSHVPITLVWQIIQTREAIVSNNATADRAVADLSPLLLGEEAALAYARRKPARDDAETRAAAIKALLEVVDRFLIRIASDTIDRARAVFRPTSTTGDADDREMKELAFHHRGLTTLLNENQNLLSQLSRQRADLRDKLAGRAVLIGSVAGGLAQDFVPTPLHDKCPGVVIHGVIAEAILTGEMLRRAPPWVNCLVTLLLGSATTWFVVRFSPWKAALAAVALAAGYLLVNGLLLYDYFNAIVGVAGPISAMVVCWSCCLLVDILAERAERGRITRRFRSYVDPTLVDYVVAHPELARLEGQKREVTVVFTDLAGFTAISERLGAGTVALLNEYWEEMIPIVRRNRGFVGKFMGDGLMFFYGAPADNPHHALDAIRTVLEMQDALGAFNRRVAERGLPALAMRAGINTGIAVVGDAGTRDASDYTALGDVTNTASRLEGANKGFGSRNLITQRTADLIGDAFLIQPVGRVRVVGKAAGILVYEVVCDASKASVNQRHRAELMQAVVGEFREGHFTECRAGVTALEGLAGDEDKFSRAYRALCDAYLRDPPAEPFDGTIVLNEK